MGLGRGAVVAGPLAGHRDSRPIEALSNVEVTPLLIGVQSPEGIRWTLRSDYPRAELIRDVLRTGEVDRSDGWALWCNNSRPP